ncbi:MAG: hypothetical protein L6R40_008631 [Gallowayella cf. fulva]|nr:MAG: hypothetical protein L6R40_008631 [Xanthomendoza cf. fulva]
MGNPNRRVVASKLASKPNAKATEQPAPLPPPGSGSAVLPCPGDCGVFNRHDEDSTWNVSDKDLPSIVKVKQAALNEALTARKFGQARKVRHWLQRFYSYHGPFDGSAMDELPQIPNPPKPCGDAACPVRNHHHAKTYTLGSEDCPSIVKIKMDNVSRATMNGEHDRAVASREFLTAFWNVHGDEDVATIVGASRLISLGKSG